MAKLFGPKRCYDADFGLIHSLRQERLVARANRTYRFLVGDHSASINSYALVESQSMNRAFDIVMQVICTAITTKDFIPGIYGRMSYGKCSLGACVLEENLAFL